MPASTSPLARLIPVGRRARAAPTASPACPRAPGRWTRRAGGVRGGSGPGRLLAAALLAGLLAVAHPARAQAPERTIDEIRTEAIARAERGGYPLIGLDPADVRDALAAIHTRDPDEWAAGWSGVARRYLEKARTDATPQAASADAARAWRLFYFGGWPVPSSPGKQAAYAASLDAYLLHARTMDPPLEMVRIPFEGSEIVGYLRLPRSAKGPVPVVLAISGLDSRKETVAETYAALLPHGIGFLAVDGPGTGQAPIRVSPDAERMFSRVLDYLVARPEVDRTRILAHGVSFGGYWATKLAIVERGRLRGVVAQSPPIDRAFQADFLRSNLLGNREYLFDVVPAFLNVVEGARDVPGLEQQFPRLSLAAEGLLGKPTAPMLVVGGAKDTQVPISDLDLLLNTGDVPKEAWINPQGGHLGREARGWTDPVIFQKVILPWEVRMAGAE